MRARWLSSLFIVFMVLLAGCEAGDTRATALIGAEGGRLSVLGATVTIPPDALVEPVQITLVQLPRASDAAAVSFEYELTPHGTQFARPVEVAIEPDNVPGWIVLHRSDEGADEAVPLPSHREGSAIVGTTTHFSRFSLLRSFFQPCDLLNQLGECPVAGAVGEHLVYGISDDGAIGEQPNTYIEFHNADPLEGHIQLDRVEVIPIENVWRGHAGERIIGTPPNERSSSGWLWELCTRGTCIDDSRLPAPWNTHQRDPGFTEFAVWPEVRDAPMSYQVCVDYSVLDYSGIHPVTNFCFTYNGRVASCPSGLVRGDAYTCREAGSSTEDCDDAADNDGDGVVDCDDVDCASDVACVGAIEVCGNGLDDDDDGFADCDDVVCASTLACRPMTTRELCANGLDDDGDGDIDCDDSECDDGTVISRCAVRMEIDGEVCLPASSSQGRTSYTAGDVVVASGGADWHLNVYDHQCTTPSGRVFSLYFRTLGAREPGRFPVSDLALDPSVSRSAVGAVVEWDGFSRGPTYCSGRDPTFGVCSAAPSTAASPVGTYETAHDRPGSGPDGSPQSMIEVTFDFTATDPEAGATHSIANGFARFRQP